MCTGSGHTSRRAPRGHTVPRRAATAGATRLAFSTLLAAMAFSAAIGPLPQAAADTGPTTVSVLARSARGTPPLGSVDVITFAPDGTLLVGDGKGAAIIAIALDPAVTGDVGAVLPAGVARIDEQLAAAAGVAADGLEIRDLAVHPRSQAVCLAALRQADKAPLLFMLRPDGSLRPIDLADVTYARVSLPATDGPRRLTDVAWAGDRLIAAAATAEEFASKIFVCPVPLEHEAEGTFHSAETFHVAHNRWETKAPMSVLMPYEHAGRRFVVGAFACTPIVRYPLDSLAPDAVVKGASVLEIGSGNRPIDMFTYEKEGRAHVLVSTFRFHHERKPFGPSPYWTVRFDRSLLDEQVDLDEKALRRLKGDEPASDRVRMIESFHGVVQMDRLGPDHVAVLREAAGGGFDLDVLPLP